MQAVQSPVIPVVAELIRKHPGTISLGQGVVYYGPPARAAERIGTFLSEPNNHKYQSVQGLPPLVELIEEKLRRENNVRVCPASEVIVTAGGNMAFVNALLAIADIGDEVILQLPYYFNHEMAITMSGCRAVLVPTDEKYQLQVDAISRAITSRTRAVVTISPNNPTGAVYGEESLRAINQLCRERGIYHISDEAYEYFTYDDARHFSPGSIEGAAEHTISLFSLSKAYGFASWRIGYLVAPAHLVTAIKKIQDTILICPPVVSQYAALGALEVGAEYCREKLGVLAEVRALALGELDRIKHLCVVPPADGAFYFLLRLDTELKPMELIERLVREHGVAAIPGTAFGMNEGCSLRVAYGALEKETVATGFGRLVGGIRAILKG